MTTPSPLYCIRTAEGDFICEVTDGPIYNPYSTFASYVVRSIKGGRLNAQNRMLVPEWKLSKVIFPEPTADPASIEILEPVQS